MSRHTTSRPQVSILTRPEGRVQPECTQKLRHIVAFQSSPGPKAECNRSGATRLKTCLAVSILTRPEGRVQPPGNSGDDQAPPAGFQSSPGPKAECNRDSLLCGSLLRGCTFQSSPGPKAECNGRFQIGRRRSAECEVVQSSYATLLVPSEASREPQASIAITWGSHSLLPPPWAADAFLFSFKRGYSCSVISR